MIKFLKNETWKELKFPKDLFRYKYAISSHGRFASYVDKIESGDLLKGSGTGGFLSVNLKPNGKELTIYLHKAVAATFLPKPGKGKTKVAHIDFNKHNNQVTNLKWVSPSELNEHQASNPAVIKERKALEKEMKSLGIDMNITRYKVLKRMLSQSKVKVSVKQLAAKYKLTDEIINKIKAHI
jgi:hypothetical protein